MSEPPRKTDLVLEHMRNGRVREAVRIAHKFKLGLSTTDRAVIKRAHEAYDPQKQDFYRQLGKDPVQLIAHGLETLYQIYGHRI